MIIRSWEEQGEQMHMFQIPVYCFACKHWMTVECGEVGQSVTCKHPTCMVRGRIEAGKQRANFFYIGQAAGRSRRNLGI